MMASLTPAQLLELDAGAFKDRMNEAVDLDRRHCADGTRKDVVILARQALLTAMKVDDGNGDRAALTQACAAVAAAALRLAIEGSNLLPHTRFAPGSLAFPERDTTPEAQA